MLRPMIYAPMRSPKRLAKSLSGPVLPPACGAGGAGRVTHTRLHSRAALRGPWCAQIVRRQIAYVGSDQLRHGLLAGEPVPDFTLPHSKLLSESHFPPGDAP